MSLDIHYPKDPSFFSLSLLVAKTSGTMCGKRKQIAYVSDDSAHVTCDMCIIEAISYWEAIRDSCQTLIKMSEEYPVYQNQIPNLVIQLESSKKEIEVLQSR